MGHVSSTVHSLARICSSLAQSEQRDKPSLISLPVTNILNRWACYLNQTTCGVCCWDGRVNYLWCYIHLLCALVINHLLFILAINAPFWYDLLFCTYIIKDSPNNEL